MDNPKTNPAPPPAKPPIAESPRLPIPIRMIKFHSPTDVIGKDVASSLSIEVNGRPTRHTIDYRPWLRAFRVTFAPTDGGPLRIGYVPDHRVSWWETIHGE